jgi:ankyrin repeat protein
MHACVFHSLGMVQHGWTPLIAAAAKGHASAVRLLLSAGANALTLDKYGKSASHYASSHGFSEVVSLLEQASREQRAAVSSRVGSVRKRNRYHPFGIFV